MTDYFSMMYFPLINTVQIVASLCLNKREVEIKINNRLNCTMIMSVIFLLSSFIYIKRHVGVCDTEYV